MSIIIFSHSDYSYLWNIIEDYIIYLKDLDPIFVSNSTNIIKPKGFNKYIEYDENQCYSQRWINILQNIDIDYILIIHDVNIIINCDIDKIKILFDIINNNNIDRCSLNVFEGTEIIDDLIQLTNLNTIKNSNTFVPYDLCPSIWKKNSFLNMWINFPDETYSSSELNNNLQNYCRNLKCYGLNKTKDKIYYCLGRPYYDFFKILHLTTKGEITYPKEVYMDTIDDFIIIFTKYNLINKIKINENYGFVINNFIPL